MLGFYILHISMHPLLADANCVHVSNFSHSFNKVLYFFESCLM